MLGITRGYWSPWNSMENHHFPMVSHGLPSDLPRSPDRASRLGAGKSSPRTLCMRQWSRTIPRWWLHWYSWRHLETGADRGPSRGYWCFLVEYTDAIDMIWYDMIWYDMIWCIYIYSLIYVHNKFHKKR